MNAKQMKVETIDKIRSSKDDERAGHVVMMKRAGMTHKQIAEVFGISAARVKQIAEKSKELAFPVTQKDPDITKPDHWDDWTQCSRDRLVSRCRYMVSVLRSI